MKTIKFTILSIFLLIFTNSFALSPTTLYQSLTLNFPGGYDDVYYVLHYRVCDKDWGNCSPEHVSPKWGGPGPGNQGSSAAIYFQGNFDSIVNVDYIEVFSPGGVGYFHYAKHFSNGVGLNAGNCWNTPMPAGNKLLIASVRSTGAFWCQQSYPFF